MKSEIDKIEIGEHPLFSRLEYGELKEKFREVKTLYKNGNLCDVKLVEFEEREYALKEIYKERIPADTYEHEYIRICHEITILYRLDHPNVIKLFWHKETTDRIVLLFESFGTKLWRFLKKKTLTEDQIKTVTRQLCSALRCLHDAGFVHRDVSSDNILINETLDIKLIDFGYANQILGRRMTVLGTFEYMAPQIIKNQPYNHKTDIWSFGILLYQLFHGKNPFASTKKIVAEEIQQNRSKMNFSLDPNTPPKAAQLIKSILIEDPQKRPDCRQILAHDWFSGVEDDFQDAFARQSERKTEKPQITANVSKDMSISELENLLVQMVSLHTEELVKKKELLSQLLRSEQTVCQLRAQKSKKPIKK